MHFNMNKQKQCNLLISAIYTSTYTHGQLYTLSIGTYNVFRVANDFNTIF